jgi:predicted nuclease with TOPRIM domain
LDDLGNLNSPITIGGVVSGLIALPFILYRVYQTLKSDRKGDDVDGRISNFTTSLQAQLDKVLARSDQLQKDYADVASKLAMAQARVEYLTSENALLRDQLQKLRDQTTAFATTGNSK